MVGWAAKSMPFSKEESPTRGFGIRSPPPLRSSHFLVSTHAVRRLLLLIAHGGGGGVSRTRQERGIVAASSFCLG